MGILYPGKLRGPGGWVGKPKARENSFDFLVNFMSLIIDLRFKPRRQTHGSTDGRVEGFSGGRGESGN